MTTSTTGPTSTTRRAQRTALTCAAALTASAVYGGNRAAAAPRSFYDAFPGLHRVWVSVDGPFNEHLVLAVVLVAVSAPTRARVSPAAGLATP